MWPSSLIRFKFHQFWIFPAFLAGHFRTCSFFPIRFIIVYCFRLFPFSGSDISGLARFPFDTLHIIRILSFPDVSVFHLRTFPAFPVFFSIRFLFHQFRMFRFHIRKFPDVSVFPTRFFFHSSGCFRLSDVPAFHVRTFLDYFVFFPIRIVFHHFRICQSSSPFGRPQRV